jgi:molybdate transport system substrate-binding protein
VFEKLTRRLITMPLAAALTGVAVAGCGTGDTATPQTRTVTVFAAASLTETFTGLGRTFESTHRGVKVTFNFGSSATLARQIVQGAPADVFAAASSATMRTVTDASMATGPTTFVRNKLQIAVPTDNPGKITGLKDLINPNVKVALCAVQVPCGAAAAKALQAAGLKVTPVTYEQDVRATLTKVELGEVDAALVYRTDVRSSAGKVKGIAFPEADKAINDYPIAALTTAPNAQAARQFVDLVLSQQGKTVLAEAGFEAV